MTSKGKKAPKNQVIPWGIDRIGAADYDGNNIEVDLYILDSGVRDRDMDLVEEIDFLERDKGKNKKKNKKNQDVLGHGTMAASIAAAEDDNDDLVGVAPGARIHNWKVLGDEGTVDSATPIAALDALVKIKQANPAQPMVANLSFGADIETTEYGALDEAVQAAIDAGIVVVVSAGNQGIDASTVTPAHVEDAITVGAYTVLNEFALFSNYGPMVDLLAPGVDILAISNDKKHKAPHVLVTGTSFAAPHVAGAAARYLSQHPSASPQEVREALVDAAQDFVWGVPAGTTDKSVWVGDF